MYYVLPALWYILGTKYWYTLCATQHTYTLLLHSIVLCCVVLCCVLVEVTKQPTCMKGACCTNNHGQLQDSSVGVGVHTCRLLSNFNQSSCNTETLLLWKNVHYYQSLDNQKCFPVVVFFTCIIIQVMWPLANTVRVYCSVYCPATAPSTA